MNGAEIFMANPRLPKASSIGLPMRKRGKRLAPAGRTQDRPPESCTSVSIWLRIRPPTMVMPSGRRSSEPVPVPSASGRPPSSAAMVVIMIGRKRSRQAW